MAKHTDADRRRLKQSMPALKLGPDVAPSTIPVARPPLPTTNPVVGPQAAATRNVPSLDPREAAAGDEPFLRVEKRSAPDLVHPADRPQPSGPSVIATPVPIPSGVPAILDTAPEQAAVAAVEGQAQGREEEAGADLGESLPPGTMIEATGDGAAEKAAALAAITMDPFTPVDSAARMAQIATAAAAGDTASLIRLAQEPSHLGGRLEPLFLPETGLYEYPPDATTKERVAITSFNMAATIARYSKALALKVLTGNQVFHAQTSIQNIIAASQLAVAAEEGENEVEAIKEEFKLREAEFTFLAELELATAANLESQQTIQRPSGAESPSEISQLLEGYQTTASSILTMDPGNPATVAAMDTFLATNPFPIPSEVRWNEETGQWDRNTGFEGRLMSAETSEYLRKLKPYMDHRSMFRDAIRESASNAQALAADMAAKRASDVAFNAAMLDDDFTTVEEEAVRAKRLELDILNRESKTSVFTIINEIMSNPFRAGMARRNGMLSGLYELVGLSVPNSSTTPNDISFDTSQVPPIGEFLGLDTVTQSWIMEEWSFANPGGSQEDFFRDMRSQAPGNIRGGTQFSAI